MPPSQAIPICLALEPRFFSGFSAFLTLHWFWCCSFLSMSGLGKEFPNCLPAVAKLCFASVQELFFHFFQKQRSFNSTLFPKGQDFFFFFPGSWERENFLLSPLLLLKRTFPGLQTSEGVLPLHQRLKISVLCETCFQGSDLQLCPRGTNHHLNICTLTAPRGLCMVFSPVPSLT